MCPGSNPYGLLYAVDNSIAASDREPDAQIGDRLERRGRLRAPKHVRLNLQPTPSSDNVESHRSRLQSGYLNRNTGQGVAIHPSLDHRVPNHTHDPRVLLLPRTDGFALFAQA